jgi:hypothetical protein
MGRKLVRDNERAKRVNPIKSGIRTGNPQLEEHERTQARRPRGERVPKPAERGAAPRRR